MRRSEKMRAALQVETMPPQCVDLRSSCPAQALKQRRADLVPTRDARESRCAVLTACQCQDAAHQELDASKSQIEELRQQPEPKEMTARHRPTLPAKFKLGTQAAQCKSGLGV